MSSTLPPESVPKPAAFSGAEHDALPAGTRFGEFEIQRVIGVGGFGIVYLAWDHSLEREVALKEYMPASLAARGAGPQITVRSSSFAETYAIGLRSFVNEARLLARFDHPSLVKVYRFWEDNATAYMVMPFLQGTTLRDTRRKMAHPPDEPWIRSVISPILAALELLHREGVFHRDIAPDNILLPPDGPPILLDFGAARRVISDRTQSLTAILKPSYAPIEQYAEMAQMRQGPWTDLYALGAVIHYLLFGTPPAPATARAVQDDADTIESRIVPGVSPRFLEAMSWMLAVRPNQRPQSGEELRGVIDGNAAVPPRGRPGVTIPPNVANVAPAPWVDPSSDATRIGTGHYPTHLPTAHVAPPGQPRPTVFSPTAQMPTARQPAPVTQGPPIGQPTSTQPPAFTQPPRTTQQQTMPPGQMTHAQHPGAGSAGPASRPATLPPLTQPPRTQPPHTQPPSRSQPPYSAPPAAAVAPPRTRPAPLGAAAMPAAAAVKPAASSKTFVIVGAVLALCVVGGALAWKFAGHPPAVAAADPAASAASGVAAADPASATAVTPPAVTVPAVVPVATTPSAPAATVPTPVVATTPPVTPATTPQTTANSPFGSSTVPTVTAGSSSSAAAASGPRTRPGTPPATTGATPPNTTTPIAGAKPGDSGALKPLPTDSYGASRPLGSPPVVARPVPTTPAYEAGPSTATEACGKRDFLSLAICVDEKCEEPRFRTTSECVRVLERKRQRENR